MMKRIAVVVVSVAAAGLAGVVGFYINEYRHLRDENAELRRVASESLRVAEQQSDVSAACFTSLNSCSRILDAENPQIRESLQRPDTKPKFAQQRGQ